MRFQDTLRPLVIASIAAAVIQLAMIADTQLWRHIVSFPFVLVALRVWVLTLAAAGIFVMPILAVVPSLRRPRQWPAAIWGALAACGFATLLRHDGGAGYSLEMWAWIAIVGSVAGLVYAIVARRQSH